MVRLPFRRARQATTISAGKPCGATSKISHEHGCRQCGSFAKTPGRDDASSEKTPGRPWGVCGVQAVAEFRAPVTRGLEEAGRGRSARTRRLLPHGKEMSPDRSCRKAAFQEWGHEGHSEAWALPPARGACREIHMSEQSSRLNRPAIRSAGDKIHRVNTSSRDQDSTKADRVEVDKGRQIVRCSTRRML